MKRATLATTLAAVLMIFSVLPASAQEAPFIGVVTKSDVDVRSGAGRAYYVVGELKEGDMVRVEKILFNKTWYQIRVPQGVNSYISKAFVDAQGDGSKGTINADRTPFNAASLRGPGESYREQGMLSKGDTVTILAEEGNFYKVEPPKDAFVFIAAGTLREATAKDLEKAGEDKADKPETPNTDKPAKPDATDKPDSVKPPVKPVAPVEPAKPVTPDTPTEPDATTQTPNTPIEPVTPDATPTPETPTQPVE